MSESGHFLYYNRSGTTYSCKLYTTSAECGASYMAVNIGGVNYYAPLGDVSSPVASHLRVCTAAGVTKAVLSGLSVRYEYTGSAVSYTVPAGKTSLTFKMWGAGGRSTGKGTGGAGACVAGTITVTPGEVLTFKVGQAGLLTDAYYGGGGGGGTYILRGSTRVAIAGGGGGGGTDYADGTVVTTQGGGGGGSASAQAGSCTYTSTCGGGASQSAGGAGGADGGTGRAAGVAGTLGVGGSWGGGGNKAFPDGGGYMGGGGGYYGGGSGAWYNNSYSYWAAPGGGGSSLVPAGCTGYAANYATPGNSSDTYRGSAGSPSNNGVIVLL